MACLVMGRSERSAFRRQSPIEARWLHWAGPRVPPTGPPHLPIHHKPRRFAKPNCPANSQLKQLIINILRPAFHSGPPTRVRDMKVTICVFPFFDSSTSMSRTPPRPCAVRAGADSIDCPRPRWTLSCTATSKPRAKPLAPTSRACHEIGSTFRRGARTYAKLSCVPCRDSRHVLSRGRCARSASRVL
jgi:hypothetical protein